MQQMKPEKNNSLQEDEVMYSSSICDVEYYHIMQVNLDEWLGDDGVAFTFARPDA